MPVNFDNVAYVLHCYAGTHGEELREKARTALSMGVALMVTESETSEAKGDGHKISAALLPGATGINP